MNNETKGLVDIGKLVFAFARIKRVTLYDDGVTAESDTDHTVMLSICACAIAERTYPKLDLGLVAQFSIIHDLVEAYAGDTNTFNISVEDRLQKEAREGKALERIRIEFKDVYPWIPDTIEKYEGLDTDEAQFVKMVDKVMTKLTHRMNNGAYLKKEGKTKEETAMHYGNQTKVLEEKYGTKFPEVISMLKELTNTILDETYV